MDPKDTKVWGCQVGAVCWMLQHLEPLLGLPGCVWCHIVMDHDHTCSPYTALSYWWICVGVLQFACRKQITLFSSICVQLSSFAAILVWMSHTHMQIEHALPVKCFYLWTFDACLFLLLERPSYLLLSHVQLIISELIRWTFSVAGCLVEYK
jgi:hypothetical protein